MTRIVIHTLDVHVWTVNSLSYIMKDSYSSESNCSGLLIEASRLFMTKLEFLWDFIDIVLEISRPSFSPVSFNPLEEWTCL